MAETRRNPSPPAGGAGQRQQMNLAPGPTRWSWVLLVAVLLSLILNFAMSRVAQRVERLTYSAFKAEVAADHVKDVQIGPSRIRGDLVVPTSPAQPAKSFETNTVEDPHLLELLEAHHVSVEGVPPESGWEKVFGILLSFGLPILIVIYLGRTMSRGAGGGGLLAVGQSKARVYMEKDVPVRFTDVAGVEEAKGELQEVVEFLKTPERFSRLGGHVPKGVMLVGPPGTGKTLLARAVAGEAGVPFFNISGSEFVEMFVGVGAARVRDLFAKAKEAAPCIIFIDELDALGKSRSAGPMAHEEREQTLNQLLVEMDGFDSRVGVILMAATNRPEILDPALLRAGRFDRHVLVDRPDKPGRVAILKLHARQVTVAPEVNWDNIAALTAGMAGAELANVINEAALLAVRRGLAAVGQAELREAIERVVAGLEKKSRVLRPEEKERVAHHEVGHALVGLALPSLGKLEKISIIPRGVSALGYTMQVPTEDRFLMTRSELENRLAQLLGGRAAEELIYGEESTGASDDLQKATQLARRMVIEFGMSPAIGLVSIADAPSSLLDGINGVASTHGPEVARLIDQEVRRIVELQHERARSLLEERVEVLREAARTLLAQEVLSGEELAALDKKFGRELRPVALG